MRTDSFLSITSRRLMLTILIPVGLCIAPAGATAGDTAAAVAVMLPTQGNNVTGVIRFTQQDGLVKVEGELGGLTAGEHGFHVHEFGNCSSADGESAGAHYNPTRQSHDGREHTHRHVGDLGNVTAAENGVAKISFNDKVVSLSGENSIIGRSIVVHEHRDDLKTDPTGGSGKRLACGVIGIAR